MCVCKFSKNKIITDHPPTTDDAVHPPPTHRPNLYYVQQHSSAAVRTAVHLVRGEQLLIVGWFLRTLYETGNKKCSSTSSSTPGTRGAVGWFLRTLYETGYKRGEFHCLTILGHLEERASEPPSTTRPPPTTHPPPTIHPRTYPAVLQYSNAAVRRAIHLTREQQPMRWLQCSRAGRYLHLFTRCYSPPRRGPSEPSPGGRFSRSPLAEVGHRRPFFRRHVVVLLCG